MQTNLVPFVMDMILTFSIFLTGASGGGSWKQFSHISVGSRIVRCKAMFNVY